MHDHREVIDGVEVKLTYFSKGGERVRVPHTGISADARGPKSLTLSVREAGLLDPLGRKLGMQDVATGARSFDRAFVVKSNQPEGARVWLTEEVRRCLVEAPGYRFKLEQGRASALREGTEDDAEARSRVMAAVAALAAGMKGLESCWRHVGKRLDAGRLRRHQRRWPRLTGRLDGHAIEVRLRRRAESMTTVIRTDRAPHRATSLSDEAIASLGGALDVKDGVVVATVPGICDDGERLLACIEGAARDTSASPQGYRSP